MFLKGELTSGGPEGISVGLAPDRVADQNQMNRAATSNNALPLLRLHSKSIHKTHQNTKSFFLHLQKHRKTNANKQDQNQINAHGLYFYTTKHSSNTKYKARLKIQSILNPL